MTQTQTTIQSGNAAAIGALTQEDILGDMFYAGTLGYFGQYIALSHVAAIRQKAGHNLAMGYGTFGYEPNVQSLFGIPRAITPGGIGVNVRVGYVVASLEGNSAKRLQLSFATGALSSSLENRVPEQMFSTVTQPVQGVSAIKALQIASGQGQRIYHITKTNQAQVLPNLHLDSFALDEINQGLAIGKEVITHTDRISVPGWTGEGYIIYDPVTGAGAYKIAGGANGGFTAVGYVINTLDTFYDVLNAIAGTLHVKIPILSTIINFLHVAKFFQSLLSAGLRCTNMAAVAIGFAMMTIFVLLASEVATMLANPLAGFVVGTALDHAVDWLVDQTQECAK